MSRTPLITAYLSSSSDSEDGWLSVMGRTMLNSDADSRVFTYYRHNGQCALESLEGCEELADLNTLISFVPCAQSVSALGSSEIVSWRESSTNASELRIGGLVGPDIILRPPVHDQMVWCKDQLHLESEIRGGMARSVTSEAARARVLDAYKRLLEHQEKPEAPSAPEVVASDDEKIEELFFNLEAEFEDWPSRQLDDDLEAASRLPTYNKQIVQRKACLIAMTGALVLSQAEGGAHLKRDCDPPERTRFNRLILSCRRIQRLSLLDVRDKCWNRASVSPAPFFPPVPADSENSDDE